MQSGNRPPSIARARSPPPTAHNGLLRIIPEIYWITVQVDIRHGLSRPEIPTHDS